MKSMRSPSSLAHTLKNPVRALAAAALIQGCSATAGSTFAPDGGAEDAASKPQIELYTTTNLIPPEASVGQVIGVYARVRDGTRTLINQSVRLSKTAGSGRYDSVANGGYSSTQAQNVVMMDHVCVDTNGTVNADGNSLVRTSGNFGRISVQAEPCTGTMTDTGFLVSRFYASEVDQDEVLRATALSIPGSPFAESRIEVRTNPVGNGSSGITALPINARIRQGAAFATIVTALDGTTPVACYMDGLPQSTNGESAEDSGCNSRMNGPREDLWRARNAKNLTTYPDAWVLHVNEPSVRNIQLIARGRGSINRQPWALTNLGGGMHLVLAQTQDPGTATFIVTLSDGMTRNTDARVEVTVE